jgi:hypothetical protein
MEYSENNNKTTTVERPGFLTFLCILTFISSGMGSISAFFMGISQDQLKQSFSEIMATLVKINPNVDEAMKAELMNMFQAGWAYFLPTLLFSAGSLAGAVLMWNMKKIGFHVYALSNLGLIFVPVLALGIQVNLVNIIPTLCFIGMYGVYLKEMK